MTWRVVQRGQEPVVVCYLVGSHVDVDLRAALPGVSIVATAEAPLQGGDLKQARSLVGASPSAPIVLVGYSAGCQPVRAHLVAGIHAEAVVCIDGTHASIPAAAWQIDVWRALAAEARRAELVFVGTCTQMTYVERISPGQKGRATATRHVLERAVGQELPPGAEVHEAGLHILSFPSPTEATAEAAAAHRHQQTAVLPDVLRRFVAPIYEGSTPAPSEPPAILMPWQDRSLSLGARCLLWCEAELAAGVREVPDGSNHSPRIEWYGEPAYRRATGKLLKLKAMAWCAVAQCAAQRECLLAGEAGAHGYMASGQELLESAAAVGTLRTTAQILSGEWSPLPGDIVVLPRTGSDAQTKSWETHVARYATWIAPANTYATLGGNEGNKWARTTRTLGTERGWIEYPRAS